MKTTLTNKIITIILSIVLIQGSAFAGVVGTPQLSGADSIACEVQNQTEYFPLGDSRGNNILSKKESIRDCQVTKIEQGECKEWRENNDNRSLTPGKYNTYESKNYSDSIGSLLAALGAYDQIEHLWSGWKGYCEIGTKSDFSWAEDPMFWASMAMSFLMQSSSEGGLLENSAVGEGINGAANTAGNAIGDVAQSAGTDLAKESADAAANSYLDTAAEYTSDGLVEAAKQGAEQFYTDMGRCMIASGFEVMAAMYEFSQEDDDGSGFECDPVDEICASEASATNVSDIMTMDEVQFNDLVAQFAEQEPAQNIYDYVYVIPPSPENGIVSFRMKQMNEMAGVTDMDQEAINELKQQVKEMTLYISMGVTAFSFAACSLGYTGADVSQPSTSDDRADLRAGLGAAINFAAKFMGPYGPVIAAVLKIVLYVATSYKSIDSCNDEDDAKEIGKRHERTQKALKFDLCHLVNVECAEYSVLAGSFGKNDCVLDGYEYCCYDQVMTKVLVEQLKAQLARDWAHCTGITLRDLNYISFKQCTDSQITDPSTIDGAHQIGLYDPFKAFQFKYKCVDMTEFLEYLKTTVGEDISMSDFEDFWNDMTEQSTNGATY